ncbi:MAG: NUDIX domain-containing protein [Campylobacterales bacterium]
MPIQTPHLSVDGIVEIYNDNGDFKGIVFIERKNSPLGIALPGGFVDIGESVEDALKREMKEEISLEVEIKDMLGVYSNPKRDPRFHTVSVVFVCKTTGVPVADDDAKRVFVYKLSDAPLNELVFDHKDIIKDYVEYRHKHIDC